MRWNSLFLRFILTNLKTLSSTLILAFSLWYGSLNAQFSELSSEYGVEVTFSGEYGSACSFADFDHDGWDDITVETDNSLRFFKNVEGNGFQEVFFDLELLELSDYNMILWVDYDNDGDKDLYLSSYGKSIYLYRRDEGDVFEEVSSALGLNLALLPNYGGSWGDYNNDGLLDLYHNVYVQPIGDNPTTFNKLYTQQEDGTFIENAIAMGVDNGNKQSFQSIFWDYDEDGWQDIFLINDRMSSANALYRNINGEAFEDVSAEMGLDQILNAMSIGVGDHNLDENIDVYISNGSAGNFFNVQDENGVYQNIAEDLGIQSNSNCWGSIWFDYDNDGYEDLYVAASPLNPLIGEYDYLYHNEGDGTFTDQSETLIVEEDISGYSVAQSDFNGDGNVDFFVSPGDEHAKLYVNDGSLTGDNNWVSISLEGVISNAEAYGSQIKVYSANKVYTRLHLCGEGYIAQHSDKEHIGIGTQSEVDSIRIIWPRGLVETYYDLPANTHYSFVETESLTPDFPDSDAKAICPGESITESIGGDFVSVQWSNGTSGDSLVISEPGNYFAVAEHSSGIIFHTDTLEVYASPPFTISFTTTDASCNGVEDGSILYSGSNIDYQELEWLNFGQVESLYDLAAGNYFYQGLDVNGCPFFGLESISQPTPIELELTFSESIGIECLNTWSGELSISGGMPPYSFDWSLSDFTIESPELSFEENHFECLNEGTLNVLATDSLGCTNSISQSFEQIVGISDLSRSGISVFPNPFTDVINIEYPDILEYRLYDLSGKLLLTGKTSTSRYEISMNTLPVGMYILKLEGLSSTNEMKVIRVAD